VFKQRKLRGSDGAKVKEEGNSDDESVASMIVEVHQRKAKRLDERKAKRLE
jgi:hypothetical protein